MAKLINGMGRKVSARDDAFFFNAMSNQNGIFNRGNTFDHTLVSANLLRIKDGMAQVQGRNYIIYPSETVDLTIENGQQGYNRIDVIALQFTRSGSSEEADIVVIKGTATTGTAQVPTSTQDDTLASGTTFQYPLYYVKLEGITVADVVDKRTYIADLSAIKNAVFMLSEDDTSIEIGNYDEWLEKGMPTFE